jgi:SulP family sulfate permease
MLILAAVLRLGFVANFISTPVLTGFKAGIGLVVVLDQVPKLLGIHITKQGFFRDLLSIAQHLPETSLITLAVAGDLRGADRHGAAVAAFPGATGRRGGAIAASWLFGLQAQGVATVGLIPQGLPALTLPDLALVAQLLPGRTRHRADELHRNDRCRARLRPPGDPADQCQPRADRHRRCQSGGALLGAMPAGGGTSQTAVVRAVGGRSQKASLVTAGAAAATMLLLAPLLGLMPYATLAAVVITYSIGLIQPAEFRAIRQVRTMEFRWALIACAGRAGARHAQGHRRGDYRVDDRAGEPDCPPARVGHRPQARCRRAATTVARTSRRRDHSRAC